jgi:hypothetical protein
LAIILDGVELGLGPCYMTQVISHKNKLIEQQSPPFKGAAIKIMVSKSIATMISMSLRIQLLMQPD